MRPLVCALLLAAAACAHGRTIKDMKDCDDVTGQQRVECNACLAQNKAGGWLGIFEYRPDAKAGERCARTK